MSHTIAPWDASMQALTVYTLGRFAVYKGDTPIDDTSWKRQKAKKLFKLLLIAPQHQILKDKVLELLWPDKPPKTAANNLHRTIFVLRRVLQPDLENAALSHYLWLRDDILALNPEALAWVDAEEFERLIRLANQQNRNLDHYQTALELYKGDFLPEDLYEDWAEQRRRVLQKDYVDTLKQMASVHIERADYQPAINCLATLLHIDPTDEGTLRELMHLYTQAGERHKALRIYKNSRQILGRELGVEPETQTTALYQAILNEQLAPAAAPRLVSPAPALPPVPPYSKEHPVTTEEIARMPLVGRQAELEALTTSLRQAQRGSGNVVFLVGERGVGKTRIGEALILQSRANGARTLHGAAFEGEGRLIYAPFVEAIRRGINPLTLDRLRCQLGPMTSDLASLLPELIVSTAGESARAGLPIERWDLETSDQERLRLFDAITAAFAIFAQDTHLLIFLDNLHAAGESSLQLLHYLVRQLKNQRILFLCTIDQDKLRRSKPLSLAVGELQRNHLAQRLDLRRLNREAVAQLCTHLLDESVAESQIPDIVFQLTEGNPFFIRELVLSLIKTGKLERQAGTWRLLPDATSIVPSSIQETIGVRLGQIDHAANRLLGVAAVIGNEFDYPLLQAATQWPHEKLLDLLDAILGEALVEPTETGYRFQHAMIRQAVYNALSKERRAWLHELVARALETLMAGQIDGQAAVLAFHYEHAGHYATALRYHVRAGDHAWGAAALREALEHYSRALEICHAATDAADDDSVTALRERRSQTYLALADFDPAISDLEQLLQTYRDAGVQTRVAETLYQIGFAHYWAHRLAQAAGYIEQALAIATELNHGELCTRTLRLRAILNSTRGDVADSAAAEAADHATQISSLRAEEHWGYAMQAHLCCDFESAQRHAQSCIEVGKDMSNTFLTLGGYFILGMSQAGLGAYQPALDSLHGALQLSKTAGEHFWRARLLNTIGWVYRDLFSLDLALKYDQASLDLARASNPRLTEAEGNALANLAATYMLRGEFATARACLDEGLALSASETFMRWRYFMRLVIIQGWLALVDGNLAEALRATDMALELARSTKARKNVGRSCLLRGHVLAAMGELSRARAALRHSLLVSQNLKSQGMILACELALADLEDRALQPKTAQLHRQAAQDLIEQIACQLTDPALRERFRSIAPTHTMCVLV